MAKPKPTRRRHHTRRPFWRRESAATPASAILPDGDRVAKISITGGFTLVDALVEGYDMRVALTEPGKASGQRKIKIKGIVTINLRFVSTDANVVKAEVTIDGTTLKPPIQMEVPGGDTGYVSVFRQL